MHKYCFEWPKMCVQREKERANTGWKHEQLFNACNAKVLYVTMYLAA